MIKGFRIKVPAAELRQHLTARANYHEHRATTKEKELPELEAMLARIKSTPDAAAAMALSNRTSYHADDPVGDLKRDIKEHRRKQDRFSFAAEHLFDEDYDLETSELSELEILR